MNKSFLLALAAALVAAPAALAHDPAGTLKNYCEDPSEWGVHDYAPPATGLAIFLGQDGNLLGDCNGDGIPADFDGHVEFAFGGGWLLSVSGDGATSGSIVCYGATGHHGEFSTFTVTDLVLGQTVPFRVEADTTSVVPPTDPAEPDCGDFQTDEGTACVGSCPVTFAAGVDGAYIVYVGQADGGTVGTLGHIETAVTTTDPLCSDDSLQITGASTDGVTYTAGVSIAFSVGANRVIGTDSVVQTGGPAANPNTIEHHDAGSTHTWTIGASIDTETREYTYTFTTTCLGVGGPGLTTGTVRVFN